MVFVVKRLAFFLSLLFLLTVVGQVSVIADGMAAAQPAVSEEKKLEIPLFSEYQAFTGIQPQAVARMDRNTDVQAMLLEEGCGVEWTFTLHEAGQFFLRIRYKPATGKSNDIVCETKMDGAYVDKNMQTITLKRIWQNETAEFAVDAVGNQQRPRQVEADAFTEYTVRKKLDNSFLVFDLETGRHTFSLECQREGLEILSLTLVPSDTTPTYEDYSSKYADYADRPAKYVMFEAEKAAYKSDATLYPLNDRSSPYTSPSHYANTLLNTIGGNNWRFSDQWIEWNFDVEETGLYQLSMRVKQTYRQGQNSSRKIYIDGSVPFEELQYITIPYNNNWQNITLGDDRPYYIYLEAGEHTLRLENTIGAVQEVIQLTDDLVRRLNELYRTLLVFTGTTPDADRDYHLDDLIPDLEETLKENLALVTNVKEKLYTVTLDKGQDYAQFEEMERHLTSFIDDRRQIQKQFSRMQTNISSLAEWLLRAQEQPLTIDYFELLPANMSAKKAEGGFFSRLWFDIKAFFASFFNDYSVVSSSEAEQKLVLWMGASGRDQAMAMKSLIENEFTPQYGIGVDLKLIDGNSLLPAVATGNGPDISISLAAKTIMDYGFRGALYNLSNFSDHEQALESFFDEAAIPFKYNGSLYALPESYSFSLLYYRKDILEQMGMQVPQTWQDVYQMLPRLSNNYLSFGLPSLAEDTIEVFGTMLYQKGGSIYDEAGTRTLLAQEEAVEAFNDWANFYTKFKMPQKLDLLTYFRTGQAPLIIAPYTFYNNLVAGAPEIEGLWGTALIPGTEREDGSISHAAVASSTGCVIFRNATDPEAAWKFLKWWTSEEAQYRYGLEMESILGPSGRIATANKSAFERLPWTKQAAAVIREQQQYTRAVPEVPGGYMTTRYVPTAMRLVVNNNVYARDALIDYSILIDQEIALKRSEFHMD